MAELVSALMDHLHVRARPPNVDTDSNVACLNIGSSKTARQMTFIIFDEDIDGGFYPIRLRKIRNDLLQASPNE